MFHLYLAIFREYHIHTKLRVVLEVSIHNFYNSE